MTTFSCKLTQNHHSTQIVGSLQ